MDKRGQVTLFIIIAVLVVAMVLVIFFIRRPVASEIPLELRPVEEYAQDCVEQASEEALLLAGQRAGYVQLQPVHFSRETEANYLYFYAPAMISMDQMDSEISSYVDSRLGQCDFSGLDFDIRAGEPRTETMISDNMTLIEVEWPITIERAELKATLEQFSAEFPISLGLLHGFASDIVEQHVGNGTVCLSCIAREGIEKDIEVSMDLYGEDMLFNLTDYNSVLSNTSYQFKFAVKEKLSY